MQVIFGRNNLPFSWLIRIVTWSHWSHCGIVDGDFVIESTASKGVTITHIDDFIKRYTHYEIATLPTQRPSDECLKLAYEQVGKGYDFLAVFGIFFRTGWEQKKRLVCSELIAYVSGNIREDRIGRSTPEMIWSMCV